MRELGIRGDLPYFEEHMTQIIGLGRPLAMPDLAPNELLVGSVDWGGYELMSICESLADMEQLYDEHFGKEFVQGINWYKLEGAPLPYVEIVIVDGLSDFEGPELFPGVASGTVWESLTGRFSPHEMDALSELEVKYLAGAILASRPVVALRILAELILRNDSRLDELLAKEEINDLWRKYTDADEVSDQDPLYAQRLSAKLLEMKIQAMIASEKESDGT